MNNWLRYFLILLVTSLILFGIIGTIGLTEKYIKKQSKNLDPSDSASVSYPTYYNSLNSIKVIIFWIGLIAMSLLTIILSAIYQKRNNEFSKSFLITFSGSILIFLGNLSSIMLGPTSGSEGGIGLVAIVLLIILAIVIPISLIINTFIYFKNKKMNK